MKKALAVFCVAALLLGACACGRGTGLTGGPAEPGSDAEQTFVPETQTQAVSATAPNDDGAPVFRLPNLPDIGSYKPDVPRYYFDEPLNEFRADGGYGTLVPYILHAEAQFDAVDVYHGGFMTADGRIVTAPIYDRIRLFGRGAEALYCAERKLLVAEPRARDEWRSDMTEEELRAYEEAYGAAVAAVTENRVIQIVAADGTRSLSFTGVSADLLRTVDYEDSFLFYFGEDYFSGTEPSSFIIYGADLAPVADLTPLLRAYPRGFRVVGADQTGFVLQASDWDERGEAKNTLLFTQGERVVKKVAADFDAEALYGDMIVSYSQVYDLDGAPLFAAPEDGALLYDPGTDHLYVADPARGTLTRIDRSGKQKTAAGLEANAFSLWSAKDGDGKPYVLLTARTKYRTDWIAVFDAGLREVYRTPYGTGVQAEAIVGSDGGAGFFALSKDGVTRLRSLTGALLAEVPAVVENGYSHAEGAWILNGEDEETYLYLYGETSVKALPKADFCLYCDGNVCLIQNRVKEEPDEWTDYTELYVEKLYECGGFSLIGDNVRGFLPTAVNGKTYYAFVCGSTAAVLDGDGNALLKTYDGTFV